MSLRSFLRDLFGLKPPPTGLRNKRDGMAWINSNADEGAGSSVLVGRVVRTRRVLFSDVWQIEPAQAFTALMKLDFTLVGTSCEAGQQVHIYAMRDHCLTPIPGDLVSDKEVEALYQPGPVIAPKERA